MAENSGARRPGRTAPSYAEEDARAAGLADVYALGLATAEEVRAEAAPAQVIAPAFALEHILVPLGTRAGKLRVAIADPSDIFAVAELHATIGLDVEILVAPPYAVLEALARLYGTGPAA